MREQIRALRLLWTTTLRADPLRTIACVVLEGAGQLSAVLTAVWLKLVIDGILTGDEGSVAVGVAGLAVIPALLLASNAFGLQMRLTLQERVGFAFEQLYAQISATLPTLAHHEQPEFRDKLALLTNNQRLLGYGVHALLGTFIMVIQTTGTFAVLSSLDPLLLLLPLAGVPYMLAALVWQRWEGAAEDAAVPFLRRARHLYELGYDAGAGKELRVFSLGGEVVRRHGDAWMSAHGISMRFRWRSRLLASAALAIAAAGFAGAVVLVAMRALRGEASVGDVVMMIAIAGRVNELIDNAAFRLIYLSQMLRHAGRFRWLLDLSEREALSEGGGEVPSRLSRGIRLDRVTFRYPGTERDVLSDVTLDLPAGAVVAVVGENGAGKTTLIKLMCRLYESNGGRILVDGVDLASFEPEAWRERITASFQDFAKLEFAVQRSVGVGDLPRVDDEGAVVGALARSGGSDVLPTLPEGLRTQLGRTWSEGAELSSGQWQKLALGRSLMRERPLLTIFDEPTASLDAETEHALFERYAAQAQDRREDGAVTVLVSHRFSTVRSADLIVVLDAGRVVEQGSHDALMHRGGLYAELYSIQARSYR